MSSGIYTEGQSRLRSLCFSKGVERREDGCMRGRTRTWASS